MKTLVFAVCLIAISQPLSAQRSARATLQVTAHIEGSMAVEFTAGANIHKLFNGAASAAFAIPVIGGSFSPSSPVAVGDTDFLISSPFAVKVLKANLLSASYTLRAALSAPDGSHVWRIDGVNISSGSEQVITPAEFYDTNNPHALVVSGPASAAWQSMAREIRFSVIAN